MKDLFRKKRVFIPLIIVFFISTLVLYQIYDYHHLKNKSNIPLDVVYIWDSNRHDPFSDENTQSLQDEYGVENVTRQVQAYNNGDQSFLAVDASFINTGVPAFDDNYFPQYPQNVTLLYGDVWTAGSEDNVAVIDESTAIYQFDKVNAVGEILIYRGINWEVIGVVTDTTAVESNLDDIIPYLVAQRGVLPVTYVYIPYFHRNNIAFEFPHDTPYSYTIKTENDFTKQVDEEDALYILIGDAENISEEAIMTAVMSADEFLRLNINDNDPIFVILIDVMILLVGYVVFRILNRDKVIIKSYVEQDKDYIQSLKLHKNQLPFVDSPKVILDKHITSGTKTDLITIFHAKTIIGVCLVRINKEVPNVLIWQLQIDKEYQNKGFGKQAMRQIIKELKTSYHYPIIVSTKKNNKAAFYFFERVGFTPINEEEDEVDLEYTDNKVR